MPGPKFTVGIEGGPELAAALSKLEHDLWSQAVADAVLAGATIIADEWRARVPVGETPHDPHPGLYRSAITARARVGKKGATGLINVKGKPQVEYAARLEYGTVAVTKRQLRTGTARIGRARRAQPSARPAFDAKREAAIAAISDRLRAVAENR